MVDFSVAFILAIVLPLVVTLYLTWTIEFHFHPLMQPVRGTTAKSKGNKPAKPVTTKPVTVKPPKKPAKKPAKPVTVKPPKKPDKPRTKKPLKPEKKVTVKLTNYQERMSGIILHPIFMTVGFFMLPAYSIMMFRACCCYTRDGVHYFHTFLSMLSIVFGVIGFISIPSFYSANYPKELNQLQTFHSQMGFLVMVATFLQFVAGMFVFGLLRKVCLLESALFRFAFVPYHFHIGFSIFIGGVVAVISGLAHLPMFGYPPLAQELMVEPGLTKYREAMHGVANCHVAVALTTILVYYVMSKDDFRVRGRILMARDRR